MDHGTAELEKINISDENEVKSLKDVDSNRPFRRQVLNWPYVKCRVVALQTSRQVPHLWRMSAGAHILFKERLLAIRNRRSDSNLQPRLFMFYER
ncbi:unnamed protein product [Pieris macdunnoughi]|uniref:Uncharacterized protein n=1 Tax=Pieris macdunnoughi TaxID=345717 RepID=A0A821SAX6_9NEOP|nr:unnamed protein product [Pieris macdunnoughi]